MLFRSVSQSRYRLIKADIKAEINELSQTLNNKKADREILKKVVSLNTQIIEDRRRLKKEIKRIDDLLREADDNGNKKQFDELLDEKEDIINMIDATFDGLDEMKKNADASGYRPYDEDEDEQDFESGMVISPLSPVSVWEAQDILENDLRSGKFDWFIIDGTLIAAANEGIVTEQMKQLRYDIEQLDPTSTPKVNIYYNRPKRAAKYQPS